MSAFREAPATLAPPLVCPRDRSALAERVAEGATLHACPRCAGIWLDAATLTRLRADAAAMDGLALHPLATPERIPDAPSTTPHVACPRCAERCDRHTYKVADGLVVDTCRVHGVWLDGGELHALLRYERGERPRPASPGPRTFEQDSKVLTFVLDFLSEVLLGIWF